MVTALLIYIIVGAFGGFLAGLFGVGGGIIFVPVLYYTLVSFYPDYGGTMQMAVGTALATIIMTNISSVRAHTKRGSVRYDLLKKIAPGMILGSLLSAWIADQLDSPSLKAFFAVAIFILAAIMITGPERIFKAQAFPSTYLSNLAGGIIGCISGLMGIGGATLSVPYMVSYRTDMKQAVGTASALGLFIAVPGTLGFLIAGWGEPAAPPYSLGVHIPARLACHHHNHNADSTARCQGCACARLRQAEASLRGLYVHYCDHHVG